MFTRLFSTSRSIRSSSISVASRTLFGMTTPASVLAGKEDMYQGIIVDPEQLPSDASAFHASLKHSLTTWRSNGNRGVWLKIPKKLSQFVPIACEEGFDFHHAEREYVMMTTWLPATENTLPANASHQVGVGAFVLHPDGKRILVVQERNGPLKGKGVWKMCTGLVGVGEDITEAAEREVLEETGVTAKFDRVLSFRQMHGAAWGKSDLFFTMGLRAVPGKDQIQIQESEIEAATWMDIDEFLQNPFYQGRPLYLQILDGCKAWAEGKYDGLKGELMQGGFRRRPELLVFGTGQEAKSVLESESDAALYATTRSNI